MEGGIEAANHRNARHKLLADIDSDQVRGVVKRCQIGAVFQCLDHGIVYFCGARELLAAVYDTMTYRIDLLQGADRAGLLIGERIENHFDGFLVCRHRCFCDFLVEAFLLIYETAVDSDTLAESLGKNLLGIRVDQLIFQRRTSTVND